MHPDQTITGPLRARCRSTNIGGTTCPALFETLVEKIRDACAPGLSDTRFELIHLPAGVHMVQLLYPETCAGHVLRFCATHDARTITDQ